MKFSQFRKDERGVSPVVGTPLMVAITVVLASAVGVSLFGMDGITDAKEPVLADAHVTYSDSHDRVTVTWYANQHADKLEVRVSVRGRTEAAHLYGVGDSVRIDRNGMVATGAADAHHGDLRLHNGDEVTVVVVAIRGGQRTVVAEHTEVV